MVSPVSSNLSILLMNSLSGHVMIGSLIPQTPVSGSCCSPPGALQSMWATWCKKYSDKVDISVDEIFLFKLFFLGFFSVYVLQYIRIFKHSWLAFIWWKWFINTLLHKNIRLAPALLLLGLNEETCLYEHLVLPITIQILRQNNVRSQLVYCYQYVHARGNFR